VGSQGWGNKTDFSSLSFFIFKASIGEDYFETTVPTARWQHSPEAILHSDQGLHYTHFKTRRLIKKAGFRQSMSRKGNCWDNAS
ncbi:hypothetical protein NW803_24975, partial [Brevibacillus laterosporus]|nr:hypothetical protein [Brevibacillus laterosporus]